MDYLSVMYSNNKIRPVVFHKVLRCYSDMLLAPNLWENTRGVLVTAEPVSDPEGRGYAFENLVVDASVLNRGHMSILEKIEIGISRTPSTYVSLHEHDVLYPADYAVNIQEAIESLPINFDYLAFNNLIGVNETGYQKRILEDFPLSILTFPFLKLQELIKNKKQEYFLNNGWCFLEPGYGGSYGAHYRMIKIATPKTKPAIHINMNGTKSNHHFTNHYLSYEKTSSIGFNQWPGDLSFLFK